MAAPPLACTVRGCGLGLESRGRAWACPRGHSYDVARSGYVNLLQPQDRKARAPGDKPAAVAARSSLLAAGVGRALIDDVVRRVRTLGLPDEAVVVDLGSGSGDALGAVAAAHPIVGVGIDLSAAAAEHAARRFPLLTWVVANADRRLPLVDGSVDLVLSLHARRNPAECARVLSPSGLLIVAVPAADDLIELRTIVLGGGAEHDRVPSLVSEHAPFFELRDRSTVRERQRLDRPALLALLGATYRGARTSAARRVEALTVLDVTVAADVCVFGPGVDGDRPSEKAVP